MNEERELALANNHESPVWDSIDETHQCYNECLKNLIENSNTNDYIFVATHNADSVELAKQIMVEKNIFDSRVRFGQLKAFSDQLTGTLANDGYKVYKYLPYGPTERVMPYLIRRG